MSFSRPALAAGLVPCGAIAGHVVGYVMAGEPDRLHGSHGHLQPAAWVAGVVATVVLVLVAARPRGGSAGPRLRWVAAGQMAAFSALEVAEHVVAGHGAAGLLTSPSFRWGLLAQVLTATALVAAANASRASGERVRALLSARRRVGGAAPRLPWPRSGRASQDSVILASPASERGPPRRLVPA